MDEDAAGRLRRAAGALDSAVTGAFGAWQALSEAVGRGAGDEQVALLFTDLAGFSTFALEAGDGAAVRLLREVEDAVEGPVVDRRGLVVKRMGDGLMAVFDGPLAAVEAALDAQDELAAVEVAGWRPRMRAGVHFGRPRRMRRDYLGVDVNIAARVGDAAKPGQVLVSESAALHLPQDAALELGRAKRLRADGTPPGFKVRRVSRPRAD